MCVDERFNSRRREGGLWMRQQHPERVGCLTKRPRRQGQLDEKQTLRKFSMHASCSLKTQNTMVHMSEFHWDVRLKRIDALCIGQWSCLARRWKAEKKFVIEPSIPLIFSALISAPVVQWWADAARWLVWKPSWLVWKPSWISVQRDDLPQNSKGRNHWNLNRAEAPSMDCLVSHTYQICSSALQP